jgi:hypothetical protein
MTSSHIVAYEQIDLLNIQFYWLLLSSSLLQKIHQSSTSLAPESILAALDTAKIILTEVTSRKKANSFSRPLKSFILARRVTRFFQHAPMNPLLCALAMDPCLSSHFDVQTTRHQFGYDTISQALLGGHAIAKDGNIH